ncbi:matrix Gla protein isoform X2 [Gymnodraco acuticeps]|nr:matrix Gla protein isoform X2 [Gymnodraco acuticeps]
MKSLLQFLAVFAAVSFCVCYDSHESTESEEDVFVPPNQANSFIAPQQGNAYNPPRGNTHYNFVRKVKTLAERRAETCEDYSPCRYYAYTHGFPQAYQRYFAPRNVPQTAPRAPRY